LVLFLIVLAIVVVLWMQRKPASAQRIPARDWGFEQREASLRTAVSSHEVSGWLRTLRLKDAHFELDPFLERVRQLATQLQSAWFARNLDSVRAFLSDATFQRLETQQALLTQQGVRDALTDFRVIHVEWVGLDGTPQFDSAHVKLLAEARDADVPSGASDALALAAAAKAPLEPFTEVWTFVRRPGAQTQSHGGLPKGNCPRCGAPYPGGAANRCQYCSAIVNSGEFDWTLAEITQGTEHIRHYALVDGPASIGRPRLLGVLEVD
jgi:hypothetical protein